MLKNFIRSNNIYSLFKAFIPENTSNIITAEHYPKKLLLNKTAPATILDLGCGAGNSIDLFSSINPEINGLVWMLKTLPKESSVKE